jgi:hypothetical protein
MLGTTLSAASLPYEGALVRLGTESRDEDQGVAPILGTADLTDHGRNQHRIWNEIGLDIGDHRRLVHTGRNPTVRHRRTGVAINGLVSGEEDGAAFLQRLDSRVLVDVVLGRGFGRRIRSKPARPEDVAHRRLPGGRVDHVVFLAELVGLPDMVVVGEQVG